LNGAGDSDPQVSRVLSGQEGPHILAHAGDAEVVADTAERDYQVAVLDAPGACLDRAWLGMWAGMDGLDLGLEKLILSLAQQLVEWNIELAVGDLVSDDARQLGRELVMWLPINDQDRPGRAISVVVVIE